MIDPGDVKRAKQKAVGGAPKRCSKGKNCSATCIERNDICLIEVASSISNSISKTRDAVQDRGEGGEKVTKTIKNKQAKELSGRVNDALRSGSREEYDKARDAIIQLNKRIISQGSESKIGLLGVPMKWDKVQIIQNRLQNTIDSLRKDITNTIKHRDIGDIGNYAKKQLDKLEKLETFAKNIGMKLDNEWLSSKKYSYEKEYEKLLYNTKASAANNRRKEYLQNERKLLDIQKTWGRFFNEDGKTLAKNQVWKETRSIHMAHQMKPLLAKLQEKMTDAAKNGDKAAYDKLERKLIRVIETDPKKPPKYFTKNMYSGWGTTYSKGSIWENDYVSRLMGEYYNQRKELLNKMIEAASSKDRPLYNQIESNLIRLQSKYEKLIPLTESDKTKKGYIWQQRLRVRYLSARGKILTKLKDSAISGNKEDYDKWESRLLRIQRKYPSIDTEKVKKGETWKYFRSVEARKKYDETKTKLLGDMEAAIASNNRKLYNRVEGKLLRLQDRYGNKFQDQNLKAKGEMWDSFNKSTHSINKLDPLNTPAQFAEAIQNTKGFYNIAIKTINDHISKILGSRIPSPEEKATYDGILKSISDRIGELQFRSGIMALKNFTSNDYKRIRAAQKKNHQTSEFSNKARLLEQLINLPELEKPQVVKFRGVTVNDKKLNDLIEAANEGKAYSGRATSSWSTSLGKAGEFSESGLGKWGNHRVIFRTINSRGIPINSVSVVSNEYEIITSKDAKYRHLGYRVVNYKSENHYIFDVEET